MNKNIGNFLCPFCDSTFNLDSSTFSIEEFNFASLSRRPYNRAHDYPERIELRMMKCPACEQVTVKTNGTGSQYAGIETCIYPNSLAKQYPNYIPEQIREDYEEAYAIVNLSPKASATLSRRALQGMIRDFHGIKKSRLVDEIDALEDVVTLPEKTVLNNIRNIGNIGAHPEKDINIIVEIEAGEAEKLLKVIEYFMKSWYINRHEIQQLFGEVNDTNKKLQEKRKNGK